MGVVQSIRDLFNPRRCEACLVHTEYRAIYERLEMASQLERDFLREQIKMLQEKLFIAVRLEVRKTVEGEAQRQVDAERRMKQTESTVTKSWPRLKQELEKAHLKKPDDDKLKYWQGVNARLEAEIPGFDASRGIVNPAGLNSTVENKDQLNLDLQELEK
jgi:hypothetical protein